MKWMIASDIHGSAFYLEKLLNRYESERADRLLLLGDLLYHGPRNDLPEGYAPKECIKMLNGMKNDIMCVRGNCDTEVDQMVLEFPILAEYAVIENGTGIIFATHGHKFNIDNLPPIRKGDILLYGHFHVPMKAERDGVICVNPGSVSIPKNESPHSYMTLENGAFLWKDMDGNTYEAPEA